MGGWKNSNIRHYETCTLLNVTVKGVAGNVGFKSKSPVSIRPLVLCLYIRQNLTETAHTAFQSLSEVGHWHWAADCSSD